MERIRLMKRFIEKIKHFYFSNKEISIIGIICILISVSYMITYNMPDYFGIEPFYSWLNNLAISYIAALIFFVVQVYVPEERNKKNCMEVLRNKFVSITTFIDVSIMLCKKHIKIKDKGADLIWNGDNEKLYIKYSKVGDDKAFTCRSYTKTEIFRLQNIFDSKISEIKNSSVIKYCDYGLLELLSQIEDAKFFDGISYVIRLANTEIGFPKFGNNLTKIESLNDKLKEMCFIKSDYQLHDIEESDKFVADLPRNDISEELKSIRDFNIVRMKCYIKQQLDAQGVSIPEDILDKMSEEAVDAQMNKGNK